MKLVTCKTCGKAEGEVSFGLMMPWCDDCHRVQVDRVNADQQHVVRNGLIIPAHMVSTIV